MFDLPYMIAVDNKVEKVNGHYLDLTGYKEMDILGREVEEVWRQLLRISADLSKLQHSKSCDCYMFDICFEAKEVTISYSEDIELKQGVYTFRQKKNSILEDKFPFLMLANSANDTGTALYSVPDFILLKANEYHHRYCRKRNTGLKSIIGKYIWDIFPDWKDSETSYIFNEAAETGKPVFSDEYMRVYPEIGNICIKYTLTPIFEEETVKYIVLIHEDVTEKVKIRDAIAEKNRIIEEQKSCLQSQRDYMYKLFNAMELPIMSLSYPELKIIEFNKKALSELREFTGMGDVVAESYLAGRSLYEMISLLNIQDEKEFFDRMKQTRCTVCHEKMEIEKNGRKVYYNITYHPFLDIMGEIVQLLIVGVDVTREVEKRKQIEEVLKLKDEFLYFMTHEFKTPLTVINAAVQTLEYVYSKQIPDKAIVLVEKVKQNSYRQLRLVNNLLEIARINSGNIKLKERNIDIVFLARAITESVAIYAQQKDIDIVFI
ncbi:MAG: PAS domain-containing protein, partial [Clostridiaceae bacterium]|nr:PAS domain-containing protein [Clostridiaceae bacterium]